MNTPSINSALPSGQKSANTTPISIAEASGAGAAESKETFNDVLAQDSLSSAQSTTASDSEEKETDNPAAVDDALDPVLAAQGQEKMLHNGAIEEKNQPLLEALLASLPPYLAPMGMQQSVSSSDAKHDNASALSQNPSLTSVETSGRWSTVETKVNFVTANAKETSDSLIVRSNPTPANPTNVPTTLIAQSNLNHAPTGEGVSALEKPFTLTNDKDQWPQQLRTLLGERLKLQIEKGTQHASIRLDPPEMGKIDISVSVNAGKLQIQINASQGDIYHMLQQSSDELRQNLTSVTTHQVEVQISSGDKQQQQKQRALESGSHISAAGNMTIEEEQSAGGDGTLLATV
ncbi:Flagellar hook-length control protein [Candidatus Regiella insecticola 5.15]|uniref:Flagellar hook-length control protein n=1 Tax=Candidatus Regiella insecticola 5.15 TaxID=1005043 RepID=G2GZ95_9ENTR|nr:flagellar hook-length control protein FliK [Candidatus Regiella insecticola]EGY28940.1 Flagellar hook-length control protein [Candidatus Regiella insecticola 5.15]